MNAPGGKFCKDCKWLGPPVTIANDRFPSPNHTCMHPKACIKPDSYDVITGELQIHRLDCRFWRCDGECGTGCGSAGRF